MIVTFLALLEMIRLKRVRVYQQGNFGPIRVYRRERPEGAPKFDETMHAGPGPQHEGPGTEDAGPITQDPGPANV
jgi:hypothetical protein